MPRGVLTVKGYLKRLCKDLEQFDAIIVWADSNDPNRAYSSNDLVWSFLPKGYRLKIVDENGKELEDVLLPYS